MPLAKTAAALILALLVLPASAAARCDGYTYAGLMGSAAQAGVSATITPLARPSVQAGHVAAWVGVGGEGLGPGASDEWLQAGLAVVPGGGLVAYYELALPGAPARAVVIRRRLAVGRGYRVAVRESRYRRERWAVWFERRRVTRWFQLRASHQSWRPVVTTEAQDVVAGRCNELAFRFSNVLTKPPWGVAWRAIDGAGFTWPGSRIVSRDPSGFVAAAGPRP